MHHLVFVYNDNTLHWRTAGWKCILFVLELLVAMNKNVISEILDSDKIGYFWSEVTSFEVVVFFTI